MSSTPETTAEEKSCSCLDGRVEARCSKHGEIQNLFMTKDEMKSAHEIAEWTGNANLTINSMIVRISKLQDYCRTLEAEHKWAIKCLGDNGIDLDAYIRFHS